MNWSRSVPIGLILTCSLSLGLFAIEEDNFSGKKPGEPASAVPSSISQTPPVHAEPKPFTSLRNAFDFIQAQRSFNGRGLPATFYVPDGLKVQDPLRQLLLEEGVGLYDTSLALLVLVESNHLVEARAILDYYVDGNYNLETGHGFELRAYPSGANGGAFTPLDFDTFYFFDFTNVYGDWLRWGDRWKFWTAHTGPNAWMINATLRVVDASKRAGLSTRELTPYLNIAETLGKSMVRLQDAKAFGGVRYGPENQYHAPDQSAPYDEINTENNISAYVAFQMLAKLTANPAYTAAASKILDWLAHAPVRLPNGEKRIGIFDPASSTFAMGVEKKRGDWILQSPHPTDSSGTWTLSALGAEAIDRQWGPRTAYAMWKTIRRRAGRTANFLPASDDDTLAGLDYNDSFLPEESLISPEWSTGGAYAIKELLAYYSAGKGRGQLTILELTNLKKDLDSMSAFIRRYPNAYALGPGHTGRREGATGFGWFCPPPEVHAMASVYFALFNEEKPDPAAWWRAASN